MLVEYWGWDNGEYKEDFKQKYELKREGELDKEIGGR